MLLSSQIIDAFFIRKFFFYGSLMRKLYKNFSTSFVINTEYNRITCNSSFIHIIQIYSIITLFLDNLHNI